MKMARIEAGMRTLLTFNKAFNRHDVAGMVQLMSDDCVFESAGPPPDGAVYSGKAAITQFWQNFFQQSPEAHQIIEHTFGFGIQCVMRWRYQWMNAAGEQKYIRGVDVFMLKNGLIYEHLSYIKGSGGSEIPP